MTVKEAVWEQNEFKLWIANLNPRFIHYVYHELCAKKFIDDCHPRRLVLLHYPIERIEAEARMIDAEYRLRESHGLQ